MADVRGTLQPGEGLFYYDEATHETTGYAPLAHVVVFDSATKLIAVPIHDVETHNKFNDETLNCVGRYRADKLSSGSNCESLDQANPPWGCKTDSDCPAGEGAGTTKGYFLIVELERVYSSVLGATLCATYPGIQNTIDAGWAKSTSQGGWGNNCSGSPKWDPSLPDDAGLPDGDWCSKTNSAATATCHDAYLSESFSAGQAFPVKAGVCVPQGFTGL
jgi:hypothetical protein